MSRAAVAAKATREDAVRTEGAHRSAFAEQLWDAAIVRCEACGFHQLALGIGDDGIVEPCLWCGCQVATYAAPAKLRWPQRA